MEITTDFNTLNGLWVFTVHDGEELLYIGCEHLRTIPTLRELRRHSLDKLPDKLTIRLVTPVATSEAGEGLVATLKLMTPPRYGSPARAGRSRKVECIDTGRVYNTMSEAARDNGITLAYLHMHLKGAPQASKCRGLRFRRV